MTEFKIATWYDTVTPESAECGDYESTGNDWREGTTRTMTEAAQWYAAELKKIGYVECDDYATEVAYATDNDIDYATGAEDSYRVALVTRDLTEKQKRVFNKLVDRYLTR